MDSYIKSVYICLFVCLYFVKPGWKRQYRPKWEMDAEQNGSV